MSDRAKFSSEPQDRRAFTAGWDKSYSRIAKAYDLAVKWLPVWKTWLRQAIPCIQGPRVLEISFGTGYLLTQYAGRFETYGIDYNRTMVRTARKNLVRKNLTAPLVQASVEDLPFADETFDSVVNTMAFSAYPDATRAMSEIRRVLTVGGRLVLIDTNFPRNGNWLGVKMIQSWQVAGDLVRDLDQVLSDHRFDYTDTEIGGRGSIHLYVATKR